MSALADAIAYRCKLKQFHNETLPSGEIRGADKEWRTDIWRESQRMATQQIRTAKQQIKARKVDNDLRKIVTADKVKWPIHCSAWADRLERIEMLRHVFDEDTIEHDLVADEYVKLKQTPDAKHLSKKVPLVWRKGETPPDPYEDMRDSGSGGDYEIDNIGVTYTVDGTSGLWIAVTNQNRADDWAVWRDRDPDSFSNFEHLFEFTPSHTGSADWGSATIWAVVDHDPSVATGHPDGYAWIINNDDAMFGRLYTSNTGPTNKYYLYCCYSAGTDNDNGDMTEGTKYYFTTERIGVDLQTEYRTGSHSGTLIDTLSATNDSASTTYRYGCAVCGWDEANSCCAISYKFENFDVQWGYVPGGGGPRTVGSIIMGI